MSCHCTMSPGFALPRRQEGVILFIALMFLVVLTLLGVSVYSTTTAEERMARNYRDTELAREAAEAALRDAKIRIKGWWNYDVDTGNLPVAIDPLAFSPTCTNGLCVNATQPVDKNFSLTDSPSVRIGDCPGKCDGTANGNSTASQKVVGLTDSQQPRYLIEIIEMKGPGFSASEGVPVLGYRITALGRGRLDTTRVLRQELYLPGVVASG